MLYRLSQHSTLLYLFNPKFTGIREYNGDITTNLAPAMTIYQAIALKSGRFFSDSKIRHMFHPRLQYCLDGLTTQERATKLQYC